MILKRSVAEVLPAPADRESVKSCLSELNDTSNSFKKALGAGMEMLLSTLTPRIRYVLDNVETINYELSKSEYADNQVNNTPLPAKGFSSDFVRKISSETVKDIPKDMVIRLLKLLYSSYAICSLCSDLPKDAVFTMYEHVFCYQCVSDSLTTDDSMCPASGCNELIGPESVFAKPSLKRRVSHGMNTDPSLYDFEEHKLLHNEYVSSKIDVVVEIMESHSKPSSDELEIYETDPSSSEKRYKALENDRPIKTIIFSQLTTMLNLLQISLDKSGVSYRRLDRTMSLPSRGKVVKEFETNPQVTVMLLSLKVENLRFNMVAACHVILLDRN